MNSYMVIYEADGQEQVDGPHEGALAATKRCGDLMAQNEAVTNVRIERARPQVIVPDVPRFLQCSECGFGQHADRRTGDWYASFESQGDEGIHLRFQCCPAHAQKAQERSLFAPLDVEGFLRWDPEEAGHVLTTTDHVVAGELSAKSPEALNEALKEALAQHRASPLQWERIDDITERAWDPVPNEWVYRPYLDEAKKAAVRSSAATLAEAMQAAGEVPRRALERFLEAVRGEPPFSPPSPAALEDRETYELVRASLGSAVSSILVTGNTEEMVARVRATVLNVVHGILGDEGHVQQLDINIAEDGRLDINMDLAYAPPAPTKEILLTFNKHTPDTGEGPTESPPFADGPGTAFGKIRDIVRDEVTTLSQQVSFLNMQPEPIDRYTAILPGSRYATVRVAPEWDQGLTTALHYDAVWNSSATAFELELWHVVPPGDGRYLIVFEGDNDVTHQQYLTYRNGSWYFG